MAEFLRAQCLDIPYLDEVIKYELANHKALVESRPQTITLGINPDSIFPQLGRGMLPTNIEQGIYQLSITV